MLGELARIKDECEEVSEVKAGEVHMKQIMKGLVYKESGFYPVGSEARQRELALYAIWGSGLKGGVMRTLYSEPGSRQDVISSP